MVMYAVVFILEILSSLTEFFFLEKQQQRQQKTKFVPPKELLNNMSENFIYFYYILTESDLNTNFNGKELSSAEHGSQQSEIPRPIPRNSVESDHGCTSRIYFDNAGDNVTLTLYNVTLTSQIPC